MIISVYCRVCVASARSIRARSKYKLYRMFVLIKIVPDHVGQLIARTETGLEIWSPRGTKVWTILHRMMRLRRETSIYCTFEIMLVSEKGGDYRRLSLQNGLNECRGVWENALIKPRSRAHLGDENRRLAALSWQAPAGDTICIYLNPHRWTSVPCFRQFHFLSGLFRGVF